MVAWVFGVCMVCLVSAFFMIITRCWWFGWVCLLFDVAVLCCVVIWSLLVIVVWVVVGV